jgi:rhodanese-related sulfurtransferase
MNMPDNSKEIKEVSPSQAMQILSEDENAILLDVRMKLEFDYVGHPPQAINIPWQESPGQAENPDFVDMVRGELAHRYRNANVEDLTILTLCRSGSRSRHAAKKLLANGFLRVINIAEGFEGDPDENRHRGTLNGWRFHGLPWEQT